MDDRDERIRAFFRDLSAERMDLCRSFYHPDVRFEDPVGTIEGRAALEDYYAGLYANVQAIGFEFERFLGAGGDTRAVTWTMRLRARKLAKGREIVVDGASVLEFDPTADLVIRHRDYFDMGAFIYEHVPLLGAVIRKIRRKLASH